MKKILILMLCTPIFGFSQSTTLLDSMLRFYNDYDNETQELQSKFKFEYNSNNLITNKEELTYYSNSPSGTKTSYTYDSNNSIDIQILSTLDSISWINYMMTDDDYDINDNKVKSIISYWNDSLAIFINSSKIEYQYDINNNLTQQKSYSWDTISSVWINSYKEDYTYDINNSQILYTSSIWDIVPSNWSYSWKREYAYNNNGFITLMAQYTWNNGWEGHWKQEYEYDLNNNLTKDSYYWWGWDGIAYSWKPNAKYEYSYNINDNIISRTIYGSTSPSSLGVSFLLFQKDDYSYNSFNEQIEHINYTWDINTLSWVNSIKIESVYVNSLIDDEITYSFDLLTNTWVFSSKKEYLYNVNGVSIVYIYSLWSSISATWTPNLKIEDINDFSGNNLLKTSFQWIPNNNLWTPTWSVSGTYDNSSLCANTYIIGDLSLCDYVIQSCGVFSVFNNNPLSNIYHDYNTNFSDSTIFFFSITTTGVDNNTDLNKINIKKLLSISDMLGRETDKIKNKLLLYIYDDGSIEKKVDVE